MKKEKKSAWILWTLFGMVFLVAVGVGFDIGDYSYICNNNEIAQVINGTWSCTEIITNGTYSQNSSDYYAGWCDNNTYVIGNLTRIRSRGYC